MRSTILCIIALSLIPTFGGAQTTSATRSKYVGYKYKGVTPESTLPNGVKHFGGSLIGNIDADPVYGVSSVAIRTNKMLWLEVSTGQDATGVTGWEVKDVLSFPSLTKADYLFFVGDPAIECRRAGKPMENLVGVGRIFRKTGLFKPTKLWSPNVASVKFEPVKVAGVVCTYSEP